MREFCTIPDGWNTWYSNSVTSHVLMPEGIALNLGFKFYNTGKVLREPLIGRRQPQGPYEHDNEDIRSGPRSYDGSYTELVLSSSGAEILIQSTAAGGEQYILVTPKKMPRKPAALLVSLAVIWNKAGYTFRDGTLLHAVTPTKTVEVFAAGESVDERNTWLTNPYLSFSLSGPVAIGTTPVALEKITALMKKQKQLLLESLRQYGSLAEAYNALRTVLAWDTIYEPENATVCSPVSRLWNNNWGGYVLFDWDTYFSAMMASIENKGLAYANAAAITRLATERGFVPNFAAAGGIKSRDRSQPPVGALAVRELYRRFREPEFAAGLFDGLFSWNRWFAKSRRLADGTLCWGSTPYTPVADGRWETQSVGDLAGAALESGQDNAPVYDDAGYDPESGLMTLADVGLTGLYINDCENLADLAAVLGRKREENELRERAEKSKDGLETLWDEKAGLYLNRDTRTGERCGRIGAANFLSLFSDRVRPERAARMMAEHFFNEREFYGQWILPACPRSDPAYHEQNYWRGRIWAPLNYLVYLALRRHNLPETRCAQKALADKGLALLMREWLEKGHVHENFNADTGEGCDAANSDKFYHWGALLALAALTEAALVAGPEAPL